MKLILRGSGYALRPWMTHARFQEVTQVAGVSVLVAAVEQLGRPWKAKLETHGDGGRDGTLLVVVWYGRRRLMEMVRGSLDSSTSRPCTR